MSSVMDDDRLDNLLLLLPKYPDGMANNILWRVELLSLLQELRRYRDKPLHCPCCDGDHL